jgi:Domain of Unknown Function (DUF1521)
MMAIGSDVISHDVMIGEVISGGASGAAGPAGLTQADALPAASFPVAQLPSAVDIAVVANTPATAAPNPAPLWSVQNVAFGSAWINLGDNYALNINQVQREVTVENRTTNETTRIFGNAEVEIDGVRSYQFWGTTSFELANGVKITANTVADTANAGAYVLDRLTVTGDDHAVIVSNLADTAVQKVSAKVIDDSTAPRGEKSWHVDDDTRDGFVLQENEAGTGWLLEDSDSVATQDALNATAIGGGYAPGSDRMSNGEFGIFFDRIITQFMMFATSFSMHKSVAEMRYTDRNAVDDHRSSSDRASELRAIENRRIIELQFLQRTDMVKSVSDFARREAMAA